VRENATWSFAIVAMSSPAHALAGSQSARESRRQRHRAALRRGQRNALRRAHGPDERDRRSEVASLQRLDAHRCRRQRLEAFGLTRGEDKNSNRKCAFHEEPHWMIDSGRASRCCA
jgi:Fe2+ transport system protein FeoA